MKARQVLKGRGAIEVIMLFVLGTIGVYSCTAQPQSVTYNYHGDHSINQAKNVDMEKIIQYDKVTLGNTEMFLSLYNTTNDRVVDGVVRVVDSDRGRLIAEVKGNTYLIIPDPKNTSGNINLICDMPGYGKVQKEINYNNPLAGAPFIEQMGTFLIANFELVRDQK